MAYMTFMELREIWADSGWRGARRTKAKGRKWKGQDGRTVIACTKSEARAALKHGSPLPVGYRLEAV